MSRGIKLFIVALAALCSACAGTSVPLGSRGPVPSGAARTIEAEACGFQLLLLIPIKVNGRAARAYRELEEKAAGDFITNVQVRERWIYGFIGTTYCTALRATAIRVGGQAVGAAYRPAAVTAAPATSVAMPPRETPAPVAASTGEALSTATALKAQPRSASQTIVIVPAGTAVSPTHRIRNGDGDWMYVRYGNDSGWMLVPGTAR